MSARITWIASLLSLLLSLGVIMGVFVLRWDALLEEHRPESEEIAIDSMTALYWDRYFMELQDLQKELEEKAAALEEERQALEAATEQVKSRSVELDEQASRLEAERGRIREWFLSSSRIQKENHQRVAKTYAVMDPVQVVPILLATSPEEAAKVLSEMRPEAVAPIWAAMINASNETEANARRVARLIELMGRIRDGETLNTSFQRRSGFWPGHLPAGDEPLSGRRPTGDRLA